MSADPILLRLRALIQESPDLKPAAEVYEKILPLVRDADLRGEPIALTPEKARQKLETGTPLLQDIELAFDVEAARALLIQLARALEQLGASKRKMPWEHLPENATTAAQMRAAFEQNQVGADELLAGIASGDHAAIAARAQTARLDPAMLETLGAYAIKPVLRAWQRQLAPLVEGVTWHHSYCFVCGARATLGELQGNDATKHLRCGQCGADWLVVRLRCLFCGNADHATLNHLYPEHARATLRARVEVCDRCHGYLKLIAAFAPTPTDLLALQDLTTLPLDYIAQARGYTRNPDTTRFISH